MKEDENEIFHVTVPTKTVDSYVQAKYNAMYMQTRGTDFWDSMGSAHVYTNVYNTSRKRCESFFYNILNCLNDLDNENLSFPKCSPSVLIKEHLVTDCKDTIFVSNKHLLKQKTPSSTKTGVGYVGKPVKVQRYISSDFIVRLVRALFPDISNRDVSTNVPSWAIKIIKSKRRCKTTDTNA